jgi:hypothetical protein
VGDFDVWLYELSLTTGAEHSRAYSSVALLLVSHRVEKENLSLQVGRISDQVGYPVEFRFQVLNRLRGNSTSRIIIVDIEIFRADVLPVELLVLNTVPPKDFPGLLSFCNKWDEESKRNQVRPELPAHKINQRASKITHKID